MVLVDTSAWIEFFRDGDPLIVNRFANLQPLPNIIVSFLLTGAGKKNKSLARKGRT